MLATLLFVASQVGCNNTCATANNGVCDYASGLCAQNTDCADCTTNSGTDWNQIILIISISVGSVAIVALCCLCGYDFLLRRRIAKQKIEIEKVKQGAGDTPSSSKAPANAPASSAKAVAKASGGSAPAANSKAPVRPGPRPLAAGASAPPAQPVRPAAVPAENRVFKMPGIPLAVEVRSGAAEEGQ